LPVSSQFSVTAGSDWRQKSGVKGVKKFKVKRFELRRPDRCPEPNTPIHSATPATPATPASFPFPFPPSPDIGERNGNSSKKVLGRRDKKADIPLTIIATVLVLGDHVPPGTRPTGNGIV
jgi:hypothetical protein